MDKNKFIFLILIILLLFTSCESVSKKINEKTALEEKELSKWLSKSEADLKTVYGQPDNIQFLDSRNRNYIYIKKKFNIKCVRKFEINPNNKIVGFSSKNCF